MQSLRNGCRFRLSISFVIFFSVAVNALELRAAPPLIPHILYPGDAACGGGCEGPMQDPAIFIPNRNGQPWGDTYKLGSDGQKNLAGYSSGRIALLRRLALRNDGEWAILIDPSWNDGYRDFLTNGQLVTGESLVKNWLLNDQHRKFLLVYSTLSVGWSNYAALIKDSDVGSQVKVCFVHSSHLKVPAALGPEAILDPEGFDNGNCQGSGVR